VWFSEVVFGTISRAEENREVLQSLGIMLLGIMNVVIAAGRAARQQDPWVWLSFFTIFLIVAVIITASLRLQNAFAELSGRVDSKTARRLQTSASAMALAANVGIVVALSFVH
jgi:hypothetical protein